MDNLELIRSAEKILNKYVDDKGRIHGDVASAVLGRNGKIYLGVCIDTPTWGLCAERAALSAMITDGEYQFSKIVAVWRDNKINKLSVLPPCGHCRQFMRDINESNMESTVILGVNKFVKLKELIPYYEWPKTIDEQT